MGTTKITFLMTVHNGEAFVRRSIESVLRQSELDITLIIRNNGSSDQSGNICREYAKKDSRIILLENSRNYLTDDGITPLDRRWWPAFESEYVSIVDHDDILDLNFAKVMYQAAKDSGAEMTMCGNSYFEYGTGKITGYRNPPQALVDTSEALGKYFKEMYGCLRTVWGILYQTNWYEDNYDVIQHLPEGLNLCTDTYYVLSFLQRSKRIMLVKDPLYHYCVRQNSGFNSLVLEKFRIHEADILLEAAQRCLEHFHIDTEENRNFLYSVHWGHMTDILKLLSKSASMTLKEKIDYIQEILANEVLQKYIDSNFDFISEHIMQVMEYLIPFIGQADSDLWSFYLVRLFDVWQKQGEKNSIDFIMLLTALCDPHNHFSFGIPMLKKEKWTSLTFGENTFCAFQADTQRAYLKDIPKLLQALSGGNPEEFFSLEDALAAAVENGNYEKGGSLLAELNGLYPESEYAFYYRIRLAELIGDRDISHKQSYAARILWSDSPDITEISSHVLSTPMMKKGRLIFRPEYLNIDYQLLEQFDYFCNFISSHSQSALMAFTWSHYLFFSFEGNEDEVRAIKKEEASSHARRSILSGFSSLFSDQVTLFDSIRDLRVHIKDYEAIYEKLADSQSKTTLMDYLLFRFYNEREYLVRNKTEKDIPLQNETEVSCNYMEDLWMKQKESGLLTCQPLYLRYQPGEDGWGKLVYYK